MDIKEANEIIEFERLTEICASVFSIEASLDYEETLRLAKIGKALERYWDDTTAICGKGENEVSYKVELESIDDLLNWYK